MRILKVKQNSLITAHPMHELTHRLQMCIHIIEGPSFYIYRISLLYFGYIYAFAQPITVRSTQLLPPLCI
jgi:hypothetical protein